MNYKEQLDLLSKSIFDIAAKEVDPNLSNLIVEHDLPRLNVYKNNLLTGVIDKLSEDFPGTKYYLGEKNFRFFARKSLFDQVISSPNIIDLSRGFPDYLASQADVHADDWLVDVARLDLLWSHGREPDDGLLVAKGLVLFWRKLCDDNVGEFVADIDDSVSEKVCVRVVEGERVLVVV